MQALRVLFLFMIGRNYPKHFRNLDHETSWMRSRKEVSTDIFLSTDIESPSKRNAHRKIWFMWCCTMIIDTANHSFTGVVRVSELWMALVVTIGTLDTIGETLWGLAGDVVASCGSWVYIVRKTSPVSHTSSVVYVWVSTRRVTHQIWPAWCVRQRYKNKHRFSSESCGQQEWHIYASFSEDSSMIHLQHLLSENNIILCELEQRFAPSFPEPFSRFVPKNQHSNK